jgi:MYXO-CTERM domain-containing protein
MVFVHASGGVNYSAASLKVPVLYELGTGDLIENGSKKPRAGMFANRGKGAPMSLVIGQGEGHDQVTALSLGMVVDLIEAIVKLRVPADADPSKGPVRLNEINEASGNYWLGNLYTKDIAPYGQYMGDKALTAFLPNEAVAMKWKMTGPGLPMSIMLPTGTCGWCGNPKDEPKTSNTNPDPGPGMVPSTPADAGGGGGSGAADAGYPDPLPPDAASTTPPATSPPANPPTTPPSTTPRPQPMPAPSGTGGSGGAGGAPAGGSSVAGGCSVGAGASPAAPAGLLLLLGAAWIARRRR